MNKAQRYKIYALLSEENKTPKSELNFTTPFELLLAVILSAQSTDKGVNRATEKLFAVANTPEAIVKLGVAGLEPYIQTIGLYHNKARHIVATSQALLDNFNGTVPEDFDSLTTLPGVGAKTANVVLNVAFGHPTIPVDTHVFRVANRTGLAPGKTPLEVMNTLLKVTPAEFLQNAHHYLLLHGRYCCKARRPDCERCPIRTLCEFEGNPFRKTKKVTKNSNQNKA